MFDNIRNHKILYGIERSYCSENNASVEFDDSLKINDELDHLKTLVLKLDDYYNSKIMHNPPPSPDYLILVNCEDKEHYDLYLIELRDVSDSRLLHYDKEIKPKFETMIENFFPQFSNIFKNTSYGRIKFYLITTYPKNSANLSDEEYRKKIKTCLLDTYASQKPLKLYNKAVLIEPRASLTIMPC